MRYVYEPLREITERDIRSATAHFGGDREQAVTRLEQQRAYLQALRDGKTEQEAQAAGKAAKEGQK